MRALVLADIHANLEALEAVLAAAPPHDVVWNLGDVVGYGASPNEVIDRVRPLGDLVVRGNHDRACSNLPAFEFSQHALLAIQWTQSVLEGDHLEWLRNLATGPVTPKESAVSCVHGSPSDEDKYLLTLDDALPSLRSAPSRITFFGHTHWQMAFATSGDDRFRLQPEYELSSQPEQYELQLQDGPRYLLNPGSVGQPRDRDWRAAFAVYDDEKLLFTWHRVPYQVAETQRRIRSVGLPNALAYRLEHGF
jgi:diadenosine tetraphosphatase ApaH/serine/threonine PP2A family protein phosphatase